MKLLLIITAPYMAYYAIGGRIARNAVYAYVAECVYGTLRQMASNAHIIGYTE